MVMPRVHSNQTERHDKRRQSDAKRPSNDDARRHKNSEPSRNVRPHAPEVPKAEPKGNRDMPAGNKKRLGRAAAGKPGGTAQG